MPVEVGIEARHEFNVDRRLLTNVGGTLGFSVLSTPGMIAMMERTAAMLVHPHLPVGKATVGFEVCVKHVNAAPEGSRCVARARLRETRDGRKLLFDVDVVDQDHRTIGVGTHERRIIDAQPVPIDERERPGPRVHSAGGQRVVRALLRLTRRA